MPHNNIDFNSKGSEDMATEITKKSLVLTTLLSFEATHHGTPRISACCMKVPQNPWATFLTVRVYLFSNFRVELRKTHNLCSRARYSHSRSSKVVDFGSNRKGM